MDIDKLINKINNEKGKISEEKQLQYIDTDNVERCILICVCLATNCTCNTDCGCDTVCQCEFN